MTNVPDKWVSWVPVAVTVVFVSMVSTKQSCGLMVQLGFGADWVAMATHIPFLDFLVFFFLADVDVGLRVA